MKTILLIFVLASSLALAGETNLTLTVDGVTYSNVTFGTVTPTKVGIFYSMGTARGVASVPLEKLSPDLQKRFNYDSARATAYDSATQRMQRPQLAQRHLVRIEGTIYDFSPALAALHEYVQVADQEPKEPAMPPAPSDPRISGNRLGASGAQFIYAQQRSQYEVEVRNRSSAYQSVYTEWRKKLQLAGENLNRYHQYMITGKVLQVASNGLLVETKALQIVSDGVSVLNGGPVVFVKNYPYQESVIDGSSVNTIAMPRGRYSYTDINGATRTIPLYDCGEFVPEENATGKIVSLNER